MPDLLVVKYGGNAIAEGASSLLAELAARHRAGGRTVLVHGGGPEIDRELAARNIPTVRIDGLRVTDAATLRVTEATLCGTVNKQLVRALLAQGIPAAGLSAQDGALLICAKATGVALRHPERSEPKASAVEGQPERSEPKASAVEGQLERSEPKASAVEGQPPDLGFVGAVTHVNPAVLIALLDAGFLPVVAPLGVAEDGSTAYNVNADTAAGAIAAALQAQTFILVTNVERVRRDPDDANSGIERMTLEQAREFLASDACRQSMKPKIAAAITAAEAGATSHICAESTHTITAAQANTGTTITP